LEDGYEPDDAPILNGMAERKPGLWLGGGALWWHDTANVSFEWLADASGHSDGQRVRVGLKNPTRRFFTYAAPGA
jgi:outer membrane protein